MAMYRVLYWQDIPTQVVAEDIEGEISVPLAERFMERIEQAAMSRGLTGSDDYLAQWRWGESQAREGTAEVVAQAVKAELEAKAD